MIDLSIIIPHYNSTETLITLIETIPNRREIQVIIVDDHSNEEEKKKLLKIKEDYENENIIFLNNKRYKKGAGACRNIGLEYADGDWILFADADDFFIDGFFQVVKKYFKSNNDVVFFKPTSIEIDTQKISDRHKFYEKLIEDYLASKNKKTETLLRYRFVVPWSKLIKKKFIIDNNIFFDEVISANDVMFSTKLGYYMKKFDVSEEAIYCVTKNKGSLTMSISEQIFDTRMGVYIKYYKFLRENLKKKEFLFLGLSGRGFLINSIQFGFKKTFRVYNELRKNKVQIIDGKILNPIIFIKKLVFYINQKKEKKKYEVFKN